MAGRQLKLCRNFRSIGVLVMPLLEISDYKINKTKTDTKQKPPQSRAPFPGNNLISFSHLLKTFFLIAAPHLEGKIKGLLCCCPQGYCLHVQRMEKEPIDIVINGTKDSFQHTCSHSSSWSSSLGSSSPHKTKAHKDCTNKP